MFNMLINAALLIMVVSILLAGYRLIKGPSTPDRIVALDTIGVYLMGVTAIVSIKLRTEVFIEVIMLIGALAFIGTVAFARFLERGKMIEYRRDR